MHYEDTMVVLETDRLILKRLQTSEIASLVDLWSDPEVTLFTGGPREKEWLQAEFEKSTREPLAEQYDLWPVIEKRTGKVVGHCGLLEKEVDGKAEIEIIYIISKTAWGNGFASEVGRALIQYAFKKMKLMRLIALIEPENTASERVAQKIGMYLEKDVVRPGGAIRKVYVIEAPDD